MADQPTRRRVRISAEAKATVVGPSEGVLLAGRYMLGPLLGQGGMGQVFRATDRELSVPVAVKVLPPETACNERAVADMKREAVLAMRLRHPGIVGLFHFAAEGECKFLVMELLEGRTLEEHLDARDTLTEAEVCTLARELGAALDYAHAEKVIHRDVKPGNVFINEREGRTQARLMDFGIARSAQECQSGAADRSGTLLYVSPEQLRGGEVDGRTDQYALAVTLYECLAGHPPFYQGNLPEQILGAAPAPIPGVGAAVSAALLRALSKDRAARFPTSTAFAEALAGEAPATPAAPPQDDDALPSCMFQVQVQGVDEGVTRPTGSYDAFDFGEVDAATLLGILQRIDALQVEPPRPGKDRCNPGAIVKGPGGEFTFSKIHGECDLWCDTSKVPVATGEAVDLAAGVGPYEAASPPPPAPAPAPRPERPERPAPPAAQPPAAPPSGSPAAQPAGPAADQFIAQLLVPSPGPLQVRGPREFGGVTTSGWNGCADVFLVFAIFAAVIAVPIMGAVFTDAGAQALAGGLVVGFVAALLYGCYRGVLKMGQAEFEAGLDPASDALFFRRGADRFCVRGLASLGPAAVLQQRTKVKGRYYLLTFSRRDGGPGVAVAGLEFFNAGDAARVVELVNRLLAARR